MRAHTVLPDLVARNRTRDRTSQQGLLLVTAITKKVQLRGKLLPAAGFEGRTQPEPC